MAYAWFDNSVKAPYSRAHHISDIPDSLDVVSMMYPADLAEFELTDMATVRRKVQKWFIQSVLIVYRKNIQIK